MPVHNCPGWPLYQTEDGIYIRAIKIASLKIELDGAGTAYFNDGYQPQHLSQAFLIAAKPEPGSYLYSSGYGELLYMSSERFESTCQRVTSESIPVANGKLKGIVGSGSNVIIRDGSISVPVANRATAGVVKTGDGLSFALDGTMSISGAKSLDDTQPLVVTDIASAQLAVAALTDALNEIKAAMRTAKLMKE